MPTPCTDSVYRILSAARPNNHDRCQSGIAYHLQPQCMGGSYQRLLVGNPKALSVSIQAWVNIFLQGQKLVSSNCHLLPPCQECGEATEVQVFFDNPLPLITFEVIINSLPSILGSLTLALPTILGQAEYHLCGIIYEGAFHFSTCVLDLKGVVWQYDDQVNDGHPSFDLAATDYQRCSPTFDYKTLKMLQGRCHAWYALHTMTYTIRNIEGDD
jgi:hypothetical protein